MPKLVGQPLKRVEDPRLISGKGQYVDDVQLPRMCYAAILRSPYAHARLRNIDVRKALQAPGVVAVITGKDILGKVGPLPCAARPVPDLKTPTHYALAVNKVYFVGHPVAVVVAEDRYLARDALELIEVDYEELPSVTDPEKALLPEAPIIHEELGTNLAFEWKIEGEDVDSAFAQAEVIVRQKFVNQRLIPVPMEPRCVVADWDSGRQLLTLWTSTQIPHLVRSLVAGMLHLPEHHIRVIAPDVGGRLWAEVAGLCGRSAHGLSGDDFEPTRQMDGDTAGKLYGIHPRARPSGCDGIGVEARRDNFGIALRSGRRHGRLLPIANPCHPHLDGIDALRTLQNPCGADDQKSRLHQQDEH